MTILRTERLVLRRWRDEDVAPMAAINADPEAMRWIASGETRDEGQTRASLAAWERFWEENGFGLFAVEIRATGQVAGLTGFAVPHFLPEVLPSVEIAWRLGRDYWGQGIATEAARAALGFALGELGIDRIIAIVQVGNGASERVAAKLGMLLERETIDPGSGRPVRVFDIRR